jgi:hypothetical protein
MTKIILLLMIPVLLYSQTLTSDTKLYAGKNHNPDGERISLHISPFFNSGSHFLNGKLNYSYENIVNFDIKLKIPLGSDVTITPFYEQRSFEVAPTKEILYKILDQQTKAGMTVSIYF